MCIAQTITDRGDGRSIAITPVVGDLFATSAVADYQRAKINLALRCRLSGRLRVGAGSRHFETKRSNLEIDDNHESRAWAKVTGWDRGRMAGKGAA